MTDQPMDLTAVLSAIGGGTGGAVAVWFAMRWVQQVVQDRDREKSDWITQLKQSRDEYQEIVATLIKKREDGRD